MENVYDIGNVEQVGRSEGQSIWVQCEGFRCLGYKDSNGVWHNSFTGEVLPRVIGVLKI